MLKRVQHGAETLRSRLVLRQSRNSPYWMEPGRSLPHSQQPATYSYPDTEQSSVCLPFHFLEIHINIILPSAPGSSKWSLSLRFRRRTLYSPPHSHTCCLPRPSHSSPFYHPHNIGWAVQTLLQTINHLLCMSHACICFRWTFGMEWILILASRNWFVISALIILCLTAPIFKTAAV